MYIMEFLKQFENYKVKLYVDMDGVIVDYVVGDTEHFDKRRPLYDSIRKLENVSQLPNVELYILSATRKSNGIQQKNIWLDNYAPFFKKENRNILSREANNMKESAILKTEFLLSQQDDESQMILIDDDPRVLHEATKVKKLILLKDTALVD